MCILKLLVRAPVTYIVLNSAIGAFALLLSYCCQMCKLFSLRSTLFEQLISNLINIYDKFDRFYTECVNEFDWMLRYSGFHRLFSDEQQKSEPLIRAVKLKR